MAESNMAEAKLSIYVRAPMRVDFAGGPSDVPPFSTEEGGAAANAAIRLYACAKANKSLVSGYDITSHDLDCSVHLDNLSGDMNQGKMRLLKTILQHEKPSTGTRIHTWSQAPLGSGLGSSASMTVAALAALRLIQGKPASPKELAETSIHIEQELLSIHGGFQDQYAAALGGFQYIESNGALTESENLPVSDEFIRRLETHSVICYSGRSRVSGDVQLEIARNYRAGHKKTVDALRRLRDLAEEARDALMNSNLDHLGELLLEDWYCRHQLHPAIVSDECKRIMELALSLGITGGKILGAGGGGCMYFIGSFEAIGSLRTKLRKTGFDSLSFSFTRNGIGSWFDKGYVPR